MTLSERIFGGPGHRSLPLPVRRAYTLAELLPRRQGSLAYRVPGEMGRELAAAFERTFSLLARAHGALEVRAPSQMLTPRWHAVFHQLVRHGLARALTLSLPLEKGLPLYYFDISSPFLGHQTDAGQPAAPRYSRGFSDDYDHALAKVVGECLERTTLLNFRMADLVRGSPRSLQRAGMRFLPPESLGVFAPWQIERRPELRFDDDSVFSWVACESLLGTERALVPAQLVYWTYPVSFGDVPEPLLREQNTNGAGGFYSLDGATLSGLLECIQRDGFFRHWLRRIPPPRIDATGIRHERTNRLIAQGHDVGLETRFFDVTSELGVPTCLCVLLRSDDELPRVSMGASCRLDGETAMYDALLEAASVHHVMAQMPERLRLPGDYEPFTDPTLSTIQRLAYWANPEHATNLEPFLNGPVESVRSFGRGMAAPADARASLRRVLDVLRRHGIEAYSFAVGHPILDELGYATARVVVPGLVPMYCEERNAPLGLARLRGAPTGDPWPPWPHPFP
ncbi:MAG TPA: YcaO-like family protein [Polyangiaceae bacterium]|nr:YcaO-like family protein [Polyangiaceae bacterium]